MNNINYEESLPYGELRQRDPADSEYKLKSLLLENDDRVGAAFNYKQVVIDGKIKEVAVYNGQKEYITRLLKLGNLTRFSSSHQWATTRLKLIRKLMFIQKEEDIDLTELISYYIDGLNANLNLSLSVDGKGFDGFIKQSRIQEIRSRNIEAVQKVKSNPIRDDL